MEFPENINWMVKELLFDSHKITQQIYQTGQQNYHQIGKIEANHQYITMQTQLCQP